MTKCGRNDPCICGSGKKFKKCCESKGKDNLLSRAKPISLQEAPSIAKIVGLTSCFSPQPNLSLEQKIRSSAEESEAEEEPLLKKKWSIC